MGEDWKSIHNLACRNGDGIIKNPAISPGERAGYISVSPTGISSGNMHLERNLQPSLPAGAVPITAPFVIPGSFTGRQEAL